MKMNISLPIKRLLNYKNLILLKTESGFGVSIGKRMCLLKAQTSLISRSYKDKRAGVRREGCRLFISISLIFVSEVLSYSFIWSMFLCLLILPDFLYLFLHIAKWSEVAQSWLTFGDLVDCSPPGSSIHGILQARILEWIAISFSRGSSQPRDRTQVSCIAGRHFNLWATRKALHIVSKSVSLHIVSPLNTNEFCSKSTFISPTSHPRYPTNPISYIVLPRGW